MILSSQVAKLAGAAHLRAIGRLDVSKAWADDGSRSASAWLAWHCHVPKGRASSLLKCARLLRNMPRTDAAMGAGRLTVDHVRLLACAHRANADAFAADEERLIEAAERCLFSAFERVIHYWIHAHAPDDAEVSQRFAASVRGAFEEDKVILQASQRGIIESTTPNVNLRTDSGGIRFRRRLAQMIDAE